MEPKGYSVTLSSKHGRVVTAPTEENARLLRRLDRLISINKRSV